MQEFVFVVHCERIPRRLAYYLRFPVNDQLIQRIKDLPEDTRKWNSGMMVWEVTTPSLLTLIKKYKGSTKIYFDFGPEESRKIFIQQIKKIEIAEEEKRKFIADLNIKKEHWVKYKQELETTYVQYIDVVHKNLKSNVQLYPHQVISTMFLNVTRNLLLALDMGTGKSLISIAYVEMNPFNKVFVITPNSLKYNYYDEVKKFTNSEAFIVGKRNTCSIEDAKYIIVNYEYFNSSDFDKVKIKFEKLDIGKIDCLISDECHRLKSTKSNTYKNFKRLFKDDIFKNNKVSKIFMSGTPAPSKAAELYTVLHQISPIDFATKKYFYEYYCGMNYNLEGFGWETDISMTKFDELFNKIAPYTYRKKKSEVLKDLPEKTYQRIVLEMTPREYEIYYDLEEGVANEFINKELHNPLAIMGKLREYTSHLKVNSVKELIDSILECGEKFVAIDFFKDSLYELHKQYPEISGLHTGDEKDYQRANVVNDFQNENGKLKIILGSEGTTKEGLTLTAASKVGMLTIPWTPGTLDQCTDRLARIGQKNAVNAYLFIYKDTIDEYVFNLIESKRSEISQVIDGEKYESDINQSIINDLVNIIKNKHKKSNN
jgi:SWI/SNF-related matrix-associated actin-dependent regulator of chromatin subfamily A-like protein 1